MINFDDNRNFYRMMLNTEVTVIIIDDESNTELTATCRDLSATGMAIELSHPIAVDTHVHVKVSSANNNVQPLDVNGKVVRVNEESSDCYVIAIAIEEID